MTSTPFDKKREATFRILHFPKIGRYTAVAWNYDQAVLLGTTDFGSYTEARKELQVMCDKYNVELKWFDGEYEVIDGLLYNIE